MIYADCTYDQPGTTTTGDGLIPQLTSDGLHNYSYDPAGNRTGDGYSIGTGNQLLSDGTYNYTYDANGNESSKTNIATGETWSYGYNAANQLISATERDADGTVEVQVEYQYDALQNRIEKDVWTQALGEAVTRYAVDGWNPAKSNTIGTENYDVWAELDGNSSLTTRYLHGDGIDQLFARTAADGSSFWLLTDHLNSVRDVLDNTGAVKDSIRYDGYGNIVSESHPLYGGHYKYTSREYDVETQLQYNHARYYDATTGRWITQDPLGFDAGDSNLYRYVHNQPSMATDPSGLEPPAGVSPGLFGPKSVGLLSQPLSPEEIRAAERFLRTSRQLQQAGPNKLIGDFQLLNAAFSRNPGQLNQPLDPRAVESTAYRLRVARLLAAARTEAQWREYDRLAVNDIKATGKILYDAADYSLEPIRMAGDLLRTTQVGVHVGLGGDPWIPKYHSWTAKGAPQNNDMEAHANYLIQKEWEHALDSAAVLGFYGAGKVGGAVFKRLGKSADKTLAPAGRGGVTRGMATSGFRNNDPFTAADISRIESYLQRLGVPAENYTIESARAVGAGGPGTSYRLIHTGTGQPLEIVVVGPNVVPLPVPPAQGGALSRVSIEGALAHEVVGHRGAEVARMGFDRSTALGRALDEAQAHYRAALYAPGLSTAERATLMRAAAEELAPHGLRLSDVRVYFYRESGQWGNWTVTPSGAQRMLANPAP